MLPFLVKGKIVCIHTVKAWTGSGRSAALICNLSIGLRWVDILTLQAPGEPLYPLN